MTFTLIPSGAHSVAATLERPRIPSFAAAYELCARLCKRRGKTETDTSTAARDNNHFSV